MKDSAGKPRVLIIVENLPVPLDRRVWQEACALRDGGYQVTVICPQMRGFTRPEEELDGIRILRHWISEEAAGLGGFVREYASALWGETLLAWKAWREGGFSIIHLCNPPDLLFLAALPFKLFFKVKVIFDVHDLWPEMFEAKFGRRGLLYWAVRLAERCTLALADGVIATNESVRAAVMTRGGKTSEQVTVVRTSPKSIDTRAVPDPGLKKGRSYLVGYVGVMGNADGVERLVRAASIVVKEMGRKDVQFLLMGTGPEYDHLVRLRDELGLAEEISLPGRVSDEFLARGLATIDLGVSCDPINSYNDHCTMNKVLEYMAFGKSQVLFDLVEGRVSAGQAARYVRPDTPAELARAIVEMLDDPVERAVMGEQGRHRLQTELSWERSAANLLSAYEKCKTA